MQPTPLLLPEMPARLRTAHWLQQDVIAQPAQSATEIGRYEAKNASTHPHNSAFTEDFPAIGAATSQLAANTALCLCNLSNETVWSARTSR